MVLRSTNQYTEVLAGGTGGLRSTNQYAEVLAEGDGNLRSTGQYIEILTTAVPPADAENTLDFGITVTAIKILNISVGNVFSLTQEGFRGVPANASSSIILSPDPTYTWAQGDRTIVDNTLDLQQSVEAFGYPNVSTTLSFTQDIVAQQPYYVDVETLLHFTQEVKNTNIYIEVSNQFDFEITTGQVYEVNVANTLTVTTEPLRRIFASNTLTFGQNTVAGKTKGIPVQEIDFEITITTATTYNRSITQDFNLGQALTYYLDDPCFQAIYHPFIGSSSLVGANTVPIDEPIKQEDTIGVTLSYPSEGVPVSTVSIRAPELDNQDTYALNRVNQETRGGELIVFADENWPKINTLTLNFYGLLKTEIDDLLTFMDTYLGQKISLTDWEGRLWLGVISTGDNTIVQNNEDNWSIAFSFVGELIDYFPEGNSISLGITLGAEVDYVRSFLSELQLTTTIDTVGTYYKSSNTEIEFTIDIDAEVIDV